MHVALYANAVWLTCFMGCVIGCNPRSSPSRDSKPNMAMDSETRNTESESSEKENSSVIELPATEANTVNTREDSDNKLPGSQVPVENKSHTEQMEADARFQEFCGPSPTGKGGAMCKVPAGKFMLGCNSEIDIHCIGDEYLYQKRDLPLFLMDRHEVTVAEYAKCVQQGGCKSAGVSPPFNDDSDHSTNSGRFCTWKKQGKEKHPVNCISWQYAADYCSWAGKRLPTEIEWEKAARGTSGLTFAWGNQEYSGPVRWANVSNRIKDYDDRFDETAPVASFTEGISPYGVYDMMGNVSEWVSDWYEDQGVADRHEEYEESVEGKTFRVVKGGSWRNTATYARAAGRHYEKPTAHSVETGFRCALSPSKQ